MQSTALGAVSRTPLAGVIAPLLALALALGGCTVTDEAPVTAEKTIDVAVTFDFTGVPGSSAGAVGMIQSIKLLPREGGAVPVTVPTLDNIPLGGLAFPTATVTVPEDAIVAWNAFAFSGLNLTGTRYFVGSLVSQPGTLAVAIPMTLNYQPGLSLSSAIFCPDGSTGTGNTCGGMVIAADTIMGTPGGRVDVTANIIGLPGTTVTVTVAPVTADWSATSTPVLLDGFGVGSTLLTWTPPADSAGSIHPFTITLTSGTLGAPDYATMQAYVTFIVGAAVPVPVAFQFGPVIVGITGYNTGTPSGSGNDLALTVNTESSIAGASAQLTQAAVGAPVAGTGLPGTTATFTVPGYVEAQTGTLTVTVTDASVPLPLTSTVTYSIIAGQYPAPGSF